MHWRPMWVSSRHIPSWASATRSGSKDCAFSTAAAQKCTASYAPAAMLASTPNLFLNRALNACMFLSGLYAEKWLSWTKPSIGSAIDARSCCSRKQSIPASLYFLVIPNEWSWVISRSESVPANARKRTSGLAVLIGPNHGRKSLGSIGAPATAATPPPSAPLRVCLCVVRLRLARGRRRFGPALRGCALDPVAPDTPLRVQLLDGHLDAHRLIFPVALEDADLGAEVADPHDLRLGDGGCRDPDEHGDRREHDGTGDALHEPLLAVVDDSMSVESTYAIRLISSCSRSGAAVDVA